MISKKQRSFFFLVLFLLLINALCQQNPKQQQQSVAESNVDNKNEAKKEISNTADNTVQVDPTLKEQGQNPKNSFSTCAKTW